MAFFFGSSPRLPAEENEMFLIEEMFLHMSYAFGNDFQKSRAFLLPIKEVFDYSDLKNEVQLKALTSQIAELFFLEPSQVTISTFYDSGLEEYARNVRGILTATPTIRHHWEKRDGIDYCDLNINSEMLDNPLKVVYLIAERLAFFVLQKRGFNFDRLFGKYLSEVAVIYFGFGIFIDGIRLVKEGWSQQSLGRLPMGMIAGANCLYAYLNECDGKKIEMFLQSNSRELFIRGLSYYQKNGLLTIDRDEWLNSNRREDLFLEVKKISSGFSEKEEMARQSLRLSPGNVTAIHNIAYFQMCQGMYDGAMEGFNKSIELKPTFAYAYNNRGYCKMMMGEIENAKADLDIAFELKPDNSFNYRNFGVYWLKKGNAKLALENFIKAFEMDSETQLIHYYLCCAYHALDQKENAKSEANLSKGIPELPTMQFPIL